MNVSQDERIKAALFFGMGSWPSVRHSALKWCMCEMQRFPKYRDRAKIDKISQRFKIGKALSFYAMRPEFYWDGGTA